MQENQPQNRVVVNNSIRFGDRYLQLDRCPHCSIAKPSLSMLFQPIVTNADGGLNQREWASYLCNTCGGVVTAYSRQGARVVFDYFPKSETVSNLIPERPKRYLSEAINSVYAPSASIMVCASSVDAMLIEKGYKDGSLYARINQAKDDHLITEGMAQWAHQVRLGANGERHPEEDELAPTSEDARRSITFTKALAEFLFVLPARVSEGLKESKP